MIAIAREQQRAVEIDEARLRRHQHCGGHRQRGRDHAADHDLETERLRRIGHRQRLGEPAGLVELDVHGVVALAERRERFAVVHALVGADREWPLDPRESAIFPGRQRLLDQGDADGVAGGEILLQIGLGPGLVGIHDQLGFGGCLANRRDPLRIAVATELDLEQGSVRRLGGRRRHGLGGAQRNCEGGGALARHRAVQQVPGPQAGRLGLEVDQGAIQRVAGGSRRHGSLQGLSRQAAGDGRLHGLDSGKGRLGGLAIAGIGDAFAATCEAVPPHFGHDGHGLGLGAPADSKTAGDRKALDSHGQGGNFAGSHFELWRNLNLLVTSSN
ncbi:hypothetical protein BJS_08776 [Bradyrhizobium japonicum SEMIA 5079]|nr:hypothetical protein BJS_08776 [Bradyrhizobium japonicum SEMIA 5079]